MSHVVRAPRIAPSSALLQVSSAHSCNGNNAIRPTHVQCPGSTDAKESQYCVLGSPSGRGAPTCVARAMGLFAQPHRFCSVSRRLRDRKPWLPLLQLSHKDYGTITFIGVFGVVSLHHCVRFLVALFRSLPHLPYIVTRFLDFAHFLPCHIGGQLWILLLRFSMARGWCRC